MSKEKSSNEDVPDLLETCKEARELIIKLIPDHDLGWKTVLRLDRAILKAEEK